MAVVDDRVFWECNSDLNADNQINPDDAILFKALINYEQSEKKVSFADHFAMLIATGIIPTINISHLNPEIFNRLPECFNFDISEETNDNDIQIYDAFESYLKFKNKKDINVNDITNFINFLKSLQKQAIITFDVSQLKNIMLPTVATQEKIYYSVKDETGEFQTSAEAIPKVADGLVAYDDDVTANGTLIESSNDKFLISDPSVKTYYGWNGDTEPRSWKDTGLCKVYTRNENDLIEYSVIHPPVDIIRAHGSFDNVIPMGTPSVFNGKTISIDGDYVAVSWHYGSLGVVYIYKYDGAKDYDNIHEIHLVGDYTNGLPVIELKGTDLFVTNPQSLTSNIQLFNFGSVETYKIETPVTTLNVPSSSFKRVGFGSSLVCNDERTKLFVGHPNHHVNVEWKTDQYTTTQTDLFTGAVFVFQKTELTWGYKETIYPDITDYEDRSLASEMNLQYGYSLAYQNNNLFVGAPRAFQVDAERREGIVYALKYVSSNSTTEETSEYQLINEINYSDSSFDTTKITIGAWNFGMSVICNSDATIVYVLHNIPTQGTFVSFYTKNEQGIFTLNSENFYYSVTTNIVNGTLAITENDVTKAFAKSNLVKVLV